MYDSGTRHDPVFVDRTGRRRRLFAIAGSAGGVVLVFVVLALLAGFTGAGTAAIPGWPAARAERTRPAPTAVPQPMPTAAASDPDGLLASGNPARSGTDPAAAGAAAPSPGTVTTTARPALSSSPTPSTSAPRHKTPTQTPTAHPTKSR